MKERPLRLARVMVAIHVATVLKRLRTPVRKAMRMNPQPSQAPRPESSTGPACNSA